MNNNGLIVYKESFIYKIKKFFKRIFRKKEIINNCHQEDYNKEFKQDKDNAENSFATDIKVDTRITDAVINKNKFLDEINGNEKALKMLSIDRLKKLEKYYDSVIKHNNEIIKKLKISE